MPDSEHRVVYKAFADFTALYAEVAKAKAAMAALKRESGGTAHVDRSKEIGQQRELNKVTREHVGAAEADIAAVKRQAEQYRQLSLISRKAAQEMSAAELEYRKAGEAYQRVRASQLRPGDTVRSYAPPLIGHGQVTSRPQLGQYGRYEIPMSGAGWENLRKAGDEFVTVVRRLSDRVSAVEATRRTTINVPGHLQESLLPRAAFDSRQIAATQAASAAERAFRAEINKLIADRARLVPPALSAAPPLRGPAAPPRGTADYPLAVRMAESGRRILRGRGYDVADNDHRFHAWFDEPKPRLQVHDNAGAPIGEIASEVGELTGFLHSRRRGRGLPDVHDRASTLGEAVAAITGEHLPPRSTDAAERAFRAEIHQLAAERSRGRMYMDRQGGFGQLPPARPVSRGQSEAAPVNQQLAAKAAHEAVTTFVTAKGSFYRVHDDGTTTRDKAARKEHPGDFGPQPRSERTVYLSPESAKALGEIQAKGVRRAIADAGNGQLGIKYLEGPSAGKFERRSVAPYETTPRPGMLPLELWKQGTGHHFGNPIHEVATAQQPAASPHGRPDRTIYVAHDELYRLIKDLEKDKTRSKFEDIRSDYDKYGHPPVIGRKYLEGPQEGKYGQRTEFHPSPQAGLTPLHLWDQGAGYRFGPPVTQIGGSGASEEKAADRIGNAIAGAVTDAIEKPSVTSRIEPAKRKAGWAGSDEPYPWDAYFTRMAEARRQRALPAGPGITEPSRADTQRAAREARLAAEAARAAMPSGTRPMPSGLTDRDLVSLRRELHDAEAHMGEAMARNMGEYGGSRSSWPAGERTLFQNFANAINSLKDEIGTRVKEAGEPVSKPVVEEHDDFREHGAPAAGSGGALSDVETHSLLARILEAIHSCCATMSRIVRPTGSGVADHLAQAQGLDVGKMSTKEVRQHTALTNWAAADERLRTASANANSAAERQRAASAGADAAEDKRRASFYAADTAAQNKRRATTNADAAEQAARDKKLIDADRKRAAASNAETAAERKRAAANTADAAAERKRAATSTANAAAERERASTHVANAAAQRERAASSAANAAESRARTALHNEALAAQRARAAGANADIASIRAEAARVKHNSSIVTGMAGGLAGIAVNARGVSTNLREATTVSDRMAIRIRDIARDAGHFDRGFVTAGDIVKGVWAGVAHGAEQAGARIKTGFTDARAGATRTFESIGSASRKAWTDMTRDIGGVSRRVSTFVRDLGSVRAATSRAGSTIGDLFKFRGPTAAGGGGGGGVIGGGGAAAASSGGSSGIGIMSALAAAGDRATASMSGLLKHMFTMRALITAAVIATGPLVAILGALGAGALGLGNILGSLLGTLFALPGLFGAVATGVAALVTALGPLTNAFKAYQSYSKIALAGSRESAIAAAQASRAARQAEMNYLSATKSVRDAQYDARRAQMDLNEARKQATRNLQDLREELDKASLNEESATLAVKQAQADYRKALADPNATLLDRQEALNRVKQAEWDLVDVQRKNKRNQEDYNQAQKKGVSGSDQVVAAQKAIADANFNLRLSQQRVIDATIDLNKARAEQAAGGSQLYTALAAYRDQLDKLGPSTRKVAEAIFGKPGDLKSGLLGGFRAIQKQASEALFTPLVNQIGNFPSLLKQVGGLLTDAAGAIGDLAAKGIAMVSSGPWKADFATIAKGNAEILTDLGDAGFSVADAFRNIIVAAQPFTTWLTGAIAGVAKKFDDWSKNVRSSGGLAHFLDDTKGRLKGVWEIFKNLFAFFGSMYTATKDIGDYVLGALERMTGHWAAVGKAQEKHGSGLQTWLQNVKPLLFEVGHFLGAVVKAFAQLASDPKNIKEAERILAVLAGNVLPKLVIAFKLLSEHGWISDFLVAVGNALDAVNTAIKTSGGLPIDILLTFFKGIGEFLKFIFEHKAIAGIFVLYASAMAVFLGAAAFGKFSGIFKLWDFLIWIKANKGALGSGLLDKIFGRAPGTTAADKEKEAYNKGGGFAKDRAFGTYTPQLDTIIGLLEKIAACACRMGAGGNAAEGEAAAAMDGAATSLGASATALDGAAAALSAAAASLETAAVVAGTAGVIGGVAGRGGARAIGGGLTRIGSRLGIGAGERVAIGAGERAAAGAGGRAAAGGAARALEGGVVRGGELYPGGARAIESGLTRGAGSAAARAAAARTAVDAGVLREGATEAERAAASRLVRPPLALPAGSGVRELPTLRPAVPLAEAGAETAERVGGRALLRGGLRAAPRFLGKLAGGPLGWAGLAVGVASDLGVLGGKGSTGKQLGQAAGATLTGAGIGASIGSVVPVLGTAIGGVIGGVVGFLYSLVKDKGLRDKIYKNVLTPVGHFFEAIGKWIAGLVRAPAKMIYDHVLTPIGHFFAEIGKTVWKYIKTPVEWVWDKLLRPILAIFIGIWIIIGKIWWTINKAIYTYFLKPIIDSFIWLGKLIWNYMIKPVYEAFVAVRRWVDDKVAALAHWADVEIWQPIMRFFHWIGDFFSKYGKQIAGKIYEWTLKPLVDLLVLIGKFIVDLPSLIEKSLESLPFGIGTAFKQAFNLLPGKEKHESGGVIGGTYDGRPDTKNVWLTVGEHVTRKRVVDKPGGKQLLAALNNEQIDPQQLLAALGKHGAERTKDERWMDPSRLYAGLHAAVQPTVRATPRVHAPATGHVVHNDHSKHSGLSTGDITINNPVREPASRSLRRTLHASAYMINR